MNAHRELRSLLRPAASEAEPLFQRAAIAVTQIHAERAARERPRAHNRRPAALRALFAG